MDRCVKLELPGSAPHQRIADGVNHVIQLLVSKGLMLTFVDKQESPAATLCQKHTHHI